MRFERLIASKFLNRGEGFSSSLVRIATWSIALGVLVMVMSVAILRGFQKEIERKVEGFGRHVVVQSQFVGNGYDEIPVSTQRAEVERIREVPGVRQVQFFAQKGGMIKTEDQIHGIVFKGVGEGYDSTFLARSLVDGCLFHFPDETPSNEIVISQSIANKLNLSVGDKARTYFWQGTNYRARAFTVVGIYNTDLSDLDDHYVVGDLRQVQRLNEWDDTLVAGFEVLVDDFSRVEDLAYDVSLQCDYDLLVSNIHQEHPALFAWLDLLNSDIVLIFIVLSIVCCLAVISALLIMIFEKTSMIGLLKTLGADNRCVRRIFLLKSAEIIGWGLLMGNAIALVLCLMQQHFHIVHLDPESYFMSYVPIDINPLYFLLISLGTLVACLLALLIPATAISKIHPARSIRVE